MFIPSWLLVAAIVAVVWYVATARGRERQDPLKSEHNPASLQHPLAYSPSFSVFSEHEIRTANISAITASQRAAERESASLLLLNKHMGKELTAEVRQSMLETCEATVTAEECWFRHAAMMHANLSAACGQVARERALEDAEAKFRILHRNDDAERMRDEWEANLTGHGQGKRQPLPYDTPWQERAHSLYYSPAADGELWWKKRE